MTVLRVKHQLDEWRPSHTGRAAATRAYLTVTLQPCILRDLFAADFWDLVEWRYLFAYDTHLECDQCELVAAIAGAAVVPTAAATSEIAARRFVSIQLLLVRGEAANYARRK